MIFKKILLLTVFFAFQPFARSQEVFVNPSDLEFGNVFFEDSATQFVQIQNVGGADLVFNSINLLFNSQFNKVDDNCSGEVIVPGAGCFVMIEFSPNIDGPDFDILTIDSNAANNLVDVNISGTGVPLPPPNPALGFNPASINFGLLTIGSVSNAKIITVQNQSDQNLDILTVSSSDPAFSITQETCTAAVILPQGICVIQVIFNPTETINYAGTVDLTSDAGDAAIALSGAGLGVVQQIEARLRFAPPALSFSQINDESLGSQDFVLTNVGDADAKINFVKMGGKTPEAFTINDNCEGQVLSPNDSCTITVSFIATEDGNYNATVEVDSDILNGVDPGIVFGSKLSSDGATASGTGSDGIVINVDGCSLIQGVSPSSEFATAILMLLGLTSMSVKALRLRAKKVND